MKKLISLACVALVLCLVSGCGGKSAESVRKEQTKLYNDYADAVEKKDDDKAKEIDKKIADSKKDLESLKLSEAEQKKFVEDDEYIKALARYTTAKGGSAAKDFIKGFLDKDKKNDKK